MTIEQVKPGQARWWIGGASAACGLLVFAALVVWRGKLSAPVLARVAPTNDITRPTRAVHRGPPFDEEAVRNYFALEGRKLLDYDPVAYLVKRPNFKLTFDWKEHPEGKLIIRTNNMGFSEDRPTEFAKKGLRVLVAGDSHTQGAVNNFENFCNVAERKLRKLLERKDVEVLNAGIGYTSPTCYLGILRKYLELDPDVFVAVLFSGNDFCDEMPLGFERGTWPRPTYPPDYFTISEGVRKRWDGPFAQGLNQLYRFKVFPDEPERALGVVCEAYQQMKTLCDEHGIAFLAVMLPTKMDVDEDDRESWHAALDALGLGASGIAPNQELSRRFVESMHAAGIRCLDPTEAMVRSEEVLYWQTDYHLGLTGNALLGDLLAAELQQML